MKIELGTYYIGDAPSHNWECEHCDNAVENKIYPNFVTCDEKGSHKCHLRACDKLLLRDDISELMEDIIKSLADSIEDCNA